jgi:hypothetical protein
MMEMISFMKYEMETKKCFSEQSQEKNQKRIKNEKRLIKMKKSDYNEAR